jgi:hypothetical protein
MNLYESQANPRFPFLAGTDSEGLQYLKSLILTLLSTLAKAAPSLKEVCARMNALILAYR